MSKNIRTLYCIAALVMGTAIATAEEGTAPPGMISVVDDGISAIPAEMAPVKTRTPDVGRLADVVRQSIVDNDICQRLGEEGFRMPGRASCSDTPGRTKVAVNGEISDIFYSPSKGTYVMRTDEGEWGIFKAPRKLRCYTIGSAPGDEFGPTVHPDRNEVRFKTKIPRRISRWREVERDVEVEVKRGGDIEIETVRKNVKVLKTWTAWDEVERTIKRDSDGCWHEYDEAGECVGIQSDEGECLSRYEPGSLPGDPFNTSHLPATHEYELPDGRLVRMNSLHGGWDLYTGYVRDTTEGGTPRSLGSTPYDNPNLTPIAVKGISPHWEISYIQSYEHRDGHRISFFEQGARFRAFTISIMEESMDMNKAGQWVKRTRMHPTHFVDQTCAESRSDRRYVRSKQPNYRACPRKR